MRASFGNGGWVKIDGLGLPGPLYVRVRMREGQLRISELYLDASADLGVGIAGRDAAKLDVSRIEALINQHQDQVLPRIGVPGPDLSSFASYYATSFGRMEEQIKEGNWVVAAIASQQLPADQDRAVTEGGVSVMRVKPQRGEQREIDDYRLHSGPTDGLTDDFLRDVARAYMAALARGERPNVAISKQVDYPLKTVQRWVYTARQRGIMPRATKGSAQSAREQ